MINLIHFCRRRFLSVALVAICGLSLEAEAAPNSKDISAPAGMVWIPGGEFTMGTDDVHSFPNERPAHRVRVDGFWMDEHDVTNAEFSKFVEATGSTNCFRTEESDRYA